MATWEDVRRIALALPGTSERTPRGHAHVGAPPAEGRGRVWGKGFVRERPLRGPDLAALGADAPDGPELGARVADEGVKAALIAAEPAVHFTTPHFDGYPGSWSSWSASTPGSCASSSPRPGSAARRSA